jgi:hypothetical protein
MKATLFIFSIIFAATVANADMGTQRYRDALRDCDKAQESELGARSSTNDIKKVVMDASNCYVKVGDSVIRKYDSDTYEETGKRFIAFANAIYAASLNAFTGPDECYPECGQLAESMRMDMTESYIKQYVTDMLDYIDTMDI